MMNTTVCVCVPDRWVRIWKIMWQISFEPTVTGSLLPISETSDTTRTEIFQKFPTETVTVIQGFWKLCEPITTVVIPAMYARITEDISGEKKPIADRATDCMTGHWESCICGDVGICWNDWMEKSEVTENSQILYGCSIYL